MTAIEREYMARSQECATGIEAASEEEAEKLLRFPCPTQAADGTWHRTTIAFSRVPVIEFYNVLFHLNVIAASLKTIAPKQAAEIESLHKLLKQRDSRQ